MFRSVVYIRVTFQYLKVVWDYLYASRYLWRDSEIFCKKEIISVLEPSTRCQAYLDIHHLNVSAWLTIISDCSGGGTGWQSWEWRKKVMKQSIPWRSMWCWVAWVSPVPFLFPQCAHAKRRYGLCWPDGHGKDPCPKSTFSSNCYLLRSTFAAWR